MVTILWRSDEDEITFKANEKHRYGLWETVSKRLKESPLGSKSRFMEVHHVYPMACEGWPSWNSPRMLTLRFLYSGPPFVLLVGRVTSRDTTTLATSPSKDTAVLADIGPIYPIILFLPEVMVKIKKTFKVYFFTSIPKLNNPFRGKGRSH